MCFGGMFSQPKYPTPPSPTRAPQPVSTSPARLEEVEKSAKRLADTAITRTNTAGLMGTRKTGGMGLATQASTKSGNTLLGG